MKSLGKCKHCRIGFKVGIKDFCSKECTSLYFDGKIHEAVASDDSHTKNLI